MKLRTLLSTIPLLLATQVAQAQIPSTFTVDNVLFNSQPCAKEWGRCKTKEKTVVAYGANGNFVAKEFAAGIVFCTNWNFSKDPIKGTVKACHLPAPPPLPPTLPPPPTPAATTVVKPTFTYNGHEFSIASCGDGMGRKCTVTIDTMIAYGPNTSFDVNPAGPYVIKYVPPGTYSCSVSTFGSDPNPALRNFERACYIPVAALPVVAPLVVPEPPPAMMLHNVLPDIPAGTWSHIAKLNENYAFEGTKIIRWGDGLGKWFYRQDTLGGTCSHMYLGYWHNDLKVCQVFTPASTAQNLSMKMGDMPVVDINQIPKQAAGFSDLRLKYHATDGITTSDIGAFRMMCGYSHMGFNDPIIYPGQNGASHLHTFFGNTGADAFSTTESLTNTGNSTCGGGIANRSSYWVPTMIDTRTNTPIEAKGNQIYYKTGYNYIPPSLIQPLPAGLRMIAGNMKATDSASSSFGGYSCQSVPAGLTAPPRGRAIPNCPVGSTLVMGVHFPQCWDGVNLDSPDHKSHMAYPKFGCPSTHPVPLTQISFNIYYPVKEPNIDTYWRLSSDNYPMGTPGGYSSHGDWMNGWSGSMNTWMLNCNQRSRDCHTNNLGDGNQMLSY